MIENAHLPPIYNLVTIAADDDPAARACAAATDGADPATLLCAGREDFLDCAVVLHPMRPLAEARLVVYVGMLGLGDAIGAVMPAGVDATYRWPNVIEVNLGAAARIDITLPKNDAAEAAVPEWLVLRACVAVHPLGNAASGPPSRDPPGAEGFEACLGEEGGGEVTTVGLLESFSRHFLNWVNRWEDDGFDPVRAMWLRHAPNHGKAIEIEAAGRRIGGTFAGIDDRGALVLEDNGDTQRIGLAGALNAR